ncbi:MAG: hypothetical protein PHC52_09785 [Syntrophales bacterium]|nr:hypothetical protein [Syntrophales bacterium]
MATVRLSKVILNDRWPGTPSDLPVPINGWDNTLDNFKTTASTDLPRYPLGTKIRAYTDNTNCPGWYTMMYLQLTSYCSGACISADFSDGKFLCAHAAEITTSMNPVDASIPGYYVVARCYTAVASDATIGAPLAVPCASLAPDGTTAYTNGYGDAYGWFWVGGVCPCKDATIMDDGSGNTKGVDMTTFSTLRRGPFMVEITGGTCMLESPDMSAVADATAVQVGPDAAALVQGWVCASTA